MGKPTGCNENFKLEYPWIDESIGSMLASVCAEVT